MALALISMTMRPARSNFGAATEWKCSIPQAIDRLLPAGAIYFNLSEEDVQRIMKHPRAMIGSDGIPQDGSPHPRISQDARQVREEPAPYAARASGPQDDRIDCVNI
jgi:hypothetical protein